MNLADLELRAMQLRTAHRNPEASRRSVARDCADEFVFKLHDDVHVSAVRRIHALCNEPALDYGRSIRNALSLC